MSADEVCSLAWHCTAAGGLNVEDLALDPSSRHQSEHLKKALGESTRSSRYTGKVPMWNHNTEEREIVDFPLDLPYERFASEYEKDPKAFQVDQYSDPQLPPLYFDHEVYKAKGSKACPVGYFPDAVPHTKKVSFFAFYWSNTLSGTRYLICTLRKSDLCKCGCKGFCTLGVVLEIIAWAFGILASGFYPAFRHDGKPFDDELRANQRGMPIAEGNCGALCEARMDLEENCGCCGFKRSSNLENPCFCCDCHRDHLFDFPASVETSTWTPKDPTEYNTRVQRAIFKRLVTNVKQLQRLKDALAFDTRKDGYCGLSLLQAFPELNLPKGARLLTNENVQDIHNLDTIEPPAELLFFDARGDHGLNFICPSS